MNDDVNNIKKEILLFLSLNRVSKSCVEKAIEIAKNDQFDLFVYYIITSEQTRLLSKTIEELGFIGFETVKKVSTLIEDEELLRAREIINKVEEKALSNEVKINSSIIKGDFYESIKDLIDKHQPAKVILTRAHWGFLTKRWFGSVVDKLIKKASCPIIVVKGKKDNDLI